MTQEQFELTRTFLKKYSLHFAETTSARLGYAMDDRFYGIDGDGHLARFRRIMDELTLEDVNSAIKRHLQYADLKIAIVTGDATNLRTLLASDAPTPITYATPKADDILAEDAVIAGMAADAAGRAHCDRAGRRRVRALARRHFKPSFSPFASRPTASRRRRCFVSSSFAESIQPMYLRRCDGASCSKFRQAAPFSFSARSRYLGTRVPRPPRRRDWRLWRRAHWLVRLLEADVVSSATRSGAG